MAMIHACSGWRGAAPARATPPLFLLQPLLRRVARGVARRHPRMFARLGAHQASRFIIDATDLPFALYLRPVAPYPILRALPRHALPECDARITARVSRLLSLIDGAQDGDAIFFSRDLAVIGDTEAVVSLRNAIDDVEGSLAASVADMFGPLGRAALALLRRRARNAGL